MTSAHNGAGADNLDSGSDAANRLTLRIQTAAHAFVYLSSCFVGLRLWHHEQSVAAALILIRL